jgi:hypothetical protein
MAPVNLVVTVTRYQCVGRPDDLLGESASIMISNPNSVAGTTHLDSRSDRCEWSVGGFCVRFLKFGKHAWFDKRNSGVHNHLLLMDVLVLLSW